jgi:hypothetical protein
MTKLGNYLVSNKAWDRYKKNIKRFMDQDAGRQTIIWAKHVNQMLSHGEDSIHKYHRIEIEALCYYNAFRNWPINVPTVSGETNEENLSILISRDYLENLQEGKYWKKFTTDTGADTDGYWDFNWSEDRFVINGTVYKPAGDTPVAQAKDEALAFLLILKVDQGAKINFL